MHEILVMPFINTSLSICECARESEINKRKITGRNKSALGPTQTFTQLSEAVLRPGWVWRVESYIKGSR